MGTRGEHVLQGETPMQLLRHLSLGVWLAWFWLAFGAGVCNPAEGKGYLTIGVVVAALAAVAVFLASAWKPLLFERFASKRPCVIVVGIVAASASLPLAFASMTSLPDWLAWVLLALAGASGAWLLLLCGRAYAGIEVPRAFILVMGSLLVAFFAYFVAASFSDVGCALLFACLPFGAAAMVSLPAGSVDEESEPATGALLPDEVRVRFFELLLGFVVFFVTIGFVRSTGLGQETGPQNFPLGAAPAMALMAAFAVAVLLFAARGKVGVATIRGCYVFAGMGISFATMTMALAGVGTLVVRTVTDVAYLMLFLSLWCAMVAASRIHRYSVGYSFGMMLAALGVGMAVGWAMQNVLAATYGSQAAYATMLIALGFLDFAYFMFGFPATAFSSFLMRKEDLPVVAEERVEVGEGASARAGMSFREASQRAAENVNLSKREAEVFLLLVKGWSNERIAENLVVSYHTIRAHVRNIYAKLGVHDRQEMLDLVDGIRMASWRDDPDAEE